MKRYTTNEIFYSIQGEGARAGSANLFLRFSGCNLACDIPTHGWMCDTEFTSGEKMTGEEIVKVLRELGGPCQNVIITGGEPLLQLDEELISLLKREGFYLILETNGTLPVPPGVDWVTCSPKVAEHAVRIDECEELRYVRAHGQGIPKPKAKATHYFISPAFDPYGLERKHLDWCIQLVKQNPRWCLSVQMHKVMRVR